MTITQTIREIKSEGAAFYEEAYQRLKCALRLGMDVNLFLVDYSITRKKPLAKKDWRVDTKLGVFMR